MATDLELLMVRVEANLKQFEKEMARARGVGVRELRSLERETTAAATRMETAFARMGAGVKNQFRGFAAGAIGALGLQQLATAGAAAIKSIADIGDAAQRLGLTTDEYQQMSFAAQLAGVETDKLAGGLKKLAVNSSEAARGNGELGDILSRNNVSIKDANGNLLSQTQILMRVAELVRNAGSEQDQAAIAMAAFGKSGVDLLGFLQDGAAGVAAAMGAAKSETVQFTAEQIAAAQRFDDEIDTLINTISVGLKGAFLDAAVGAADFAGQAIASLDAVGLKVEGLGNSLFAITKMLPGIGAVVQFGEAASMRGQAINAAKSAQKVTPASGKVELPGNVDVLGSFRTPTKLRDYDADAKAKAADALAKQRAAEAKRLADAARREAEAKAKAIADVVNGLKFEYAQMQRTDLQQRIHNELRQAGVTAASAQGREIAALATQNYNLEASEKFAAASGQMRLDQMEAQQEATQALRDAQMELAGTFVDAFDAIIVQGQEVDDVLKNLARTLASSSLQGLLMGQGPFGQLFGASKGGGIIGSILGGLGGKSFGGLYAQGGRIGANQYGIVGEGGGMRHAEIVSGPATVTPMRKMGGGTSLVFAPNINASGADPAQMAALRNQLYTMQRDFSKMVSGSVSRENRLNPAFSS